MTTGTKVPIGAFPKHALQVGHRSIRINRLHLLFRDRRRRQLWERAGW